MGSLPVANPAPLRRPQLKRRLLVFVVLPLALASVSAIVLSFAWPQQATAPHPDWQRLADARELSVGEPVHVAEHGIWLVKQDSGEVLALWERDPHLGCAVPWRPEFEFQGTKGWFRNPCHAETYDLQGVCHFGPCPRGLDRFPAAVVDGEVWVDTNTVLCGPGWTPESTGCLPPGQYAGTPPTPNPGLP
jgi:nitrite reductase/ring-hydroxylating ferredoxin subunit